MRPAASEPRVPDLAASRSTDTPVRVDVAVVGGGVIGRSTAWRLTQRGARVAVIDPGRRTDAPVASWAAAGMLAPVSEVTYGEEPLLRLNLASRARWPAFADELAAASRLDPGYRETGTLLVARDRDDREAVDELLDFMRSLDLEVERLRAREARRLEPALAPRTRGGVLVPDDHQVDNRALLEALEAVCARAGVVEVEGRADEIDRDGGRAVGVQLASGGRVEAATVVLAAGAWSGTIGGLPAGSVPVRPVKGQLLHLRGPADPPLLTRTVRGLDVYLVPRDDGRLVVGATQEERGFEDGPTAGGVLHLLREAFELVPGITELQLDEVAVGLRPGTPDNAPLIGDGPLDHLVVAAGHHRNGILLTPITSESVAELVDTGRLPDVVAPFDPARFGGADRAEAG